LCKRAQKLYDRLLESIKIYSLQPPIYCTRYLLLQTIDDIYCCAYSADRSLFTYPIRSSASTVPSIQSCRKSCAG
jgi:hypothetical protein